MSNLKLYKTKDLLEKERNEIIKYFNHYLFSYEAIEQIFDSNSSIIKYKNTIDDIFRLRLLSYYEKCILKDDGLPYDYILKENKEYLNLLKDELKTIDMNNITGYQEMLIDSLDSLIESNNTKIINVPFYKSEYFKELMHLRKENEINIYYYITEVLGLSLGTKTPSISTKRNINSKIIRLYYDILNSKTLRNNLLENKESNKINKLYEYIDKESIYRFISYSEERNICLETVLLMYIINHLSHIVDIETIEKFYDEEMLENIADESNYIIDYNLNGMYIKNIVEPKIKLLKK